MHWHNTVDTEQIYPPQTYNEIPRASINVRPSIKVFQRICVMFTGNNLISLRSRFESPGQTIIISHGLKNVDVCVYRSIWVATNYWRFQRVHIQKLYSTGGGNLPALFFWTFLANVITVIVGAECYNSLNHVVSATHPFPSIDLAENQLESDEYSLPS